MKLIMPIEEMTKQEKLRMMEALWIDLTRSEEEFISPNWHQDVLKAREERVAAGQEQYLDWTAAKKELQSRFL